MNNKIKLFTFLLAVSIANQNMAMDKIESFPWNLSSAEIDLLKASKGKLFLSGDSCCEDVEDIFYLWRFNGDINCKDVSGNTALHYAIIRDEGNMARFLLFMGADLEVKNNEGKTPLQCAISDEGKEEISHLRHLHFGGPVVYKSGLNAAQVLKNFIAVQACKP